ncbi:MAG: dockerin type I domain-containing protein [Patescibacteria group bacterium]
MTRFTFQENGQTKTETALPNTSRSSPVDDNRDGRWVTASTPTGDNFLTLAFYSKPYKGACPPREFQMDHLLDKPNLSVVQNKVTFEPEAGYYLESRAMIFPYRHDERLPDQSQNLGQLIDTFQSTGGLMPAWECNRADISWPSTTPIPSISPTRIPTPTNTPIPSIPVIPTNTLVPTETPVSDCELCDKMINQLDSKKLGDADCDGQVAMADFAIWRNDFFNPSDQKHQADFNCDGQVTMIDFAIWRDSFWE